VIKYFVTTLVLASTMVAVAAPKKRKQAPEIISIEVSTREEAINENKSIDEKAYKKTIQASEAQQANVSSFLKLQDPTPELRDRAWLWTFAFKMQSLEPVGTGKVSDLTFDLQSYGKSVMPSMEFGFLLNAVDAKYVAWSTGLSAHAGYMSQKTDLITPAGYTYADTRLTTTLASAVWANRFKLNAAPKVSFLVNPEIGAVNYTQSSTQSSIANFSQQNNFWGLGVGAEYLFNRKWAVLAQYSYREANQQEESASNLQKNNLEIGTQVTW